MSEATGTGQGDTGQEQGPLSNQGANEFTEMIGKQPGDTSQAQGAQGSGQGGGTPQKTAAQADKTGQQQQGQGDQGQQQGGDGTGVTKTAATATLTKEELASIVDSAVRGGTQAAAAAASSSPQVRQDAKELTPAEFNAKYGIVTITPEHMQALLDTDPKKAAVVLNNLLQAQLRAGVLMSKDLFEAELQKMRGEFEPHLRSWQTQQAKIADQEAEESFFKSFPDLKDERELVMEMKDAVLARINSGQHNFGKPGTPEFGQKAFQAVAEASRKLVARMNKQTSGATKQQSSSQGQGSRQMTAASAAGRSGTGQTAGTSDEAKIFGEDWK